MDDGDGGQQVQQQLCQLLGLVDAAAHVVQVHGKGEDEADLRQLGGLEGEACQLVPGVVVGVARVVADGQRADAHVADEQGGQHQSPGDSHMHRPYLHEAAVVDAGEQQRHAQAQHGCTALHHGAAVVADAGDGTGEFVHGKAIALLRGPGRQRHHGHGAAEDAQQQVEFIGPFPILSNAFQESTTFQKEHRAYKPSLSLLYTGGGAFAIAGV